MNTKLHGFYNGWTLVPAASRRLFQKKYILMACYFIAYLITSCCFLFKFPFSQLAIPYKAIYSCSVFFNVSIFILLPWLSLSIIYRKNHFPFLPCHQYTWPVVITWVYGFFNRFFFWERCYFACFRAMLTGSSKVLKITDVLLLSGPIRLRWANKQNTHLYFRLCMFINECVMTLFK